MARDRIFQGAEEPDSRSAESRSSQPGSSDLRSLPGAEAGRLAGGFNTDDERNDEELRPQTLNEVVGQRKVLERLRINLHATLKRQEPLGHLLLDGPPGLGKTTLALTMAREMGVECQITSGPAIDAPKDLLSYLTNASYGSVLFIDEIHRLRPAVEEFIYPVMEDFRVDIVLGEGLNARTINMKLKPFTIIGATTRSGMLTAPLRDRFTFREHLDFYSEDDLAEIVVRNARKFKTELAPDAATEIARRSRGTPRKANNLLRWARDFATVHHVRGDITSDIIRRALEMLEVDPLGLDRQDRRYLEVLLRVFAGGPAGIQAVGHTMNVPPDTLEDEVEPFLLRLGFIQRTPRGRIITAAALSHLGLSLPEAPDADTQQRLF